MYVALYARVSTTRQAEKDLSIPDQLNQMREWCAANNHVVVQEFIEPGASATDDKRPVFQQMVANATTITPPYQAIVVHSRSRFFRDLYEFLFYERRLKRSGCKVLSITQQTSDDPAGEMASKIFSLFDEYSSKENGKHTLRAMKENAKRNYFNGSRPCYGYRAVDCFMDAEETKKKKRVEIDPEEADIVREIFNLYLNGKQGRSLGILEIAQTLNDRCITIRGSKWNKSRIHEVLSNRAYIGEYYFNKREHKTRTIKPESEWILLTIESIIELATFEIVRIRRESRAPDKVAPRILNSPTLLTGLLKCGICGAGLTTATGKSGRYKYYKCTTRTSQGKHACDSAALPMDKLDSVVMETLLNKVLVPERLKVMLKELQKRQEAMLLTQDDLLKPLQRELEQIITGTNRLYEAVEQGKLPLDDLLQQRAQKLKTRREEITHEIATIERQQPMPMEILTKGKLDVFAKAMRKVMHERLSTTGKDYLRLLVSEIRVTGKQAEISGSYAAFMSAMVETKAETVVPTFVPNWLPDLDSNQGPAD